MSQITDKRHFTGALNSFLTFHASGDDNLRNKVEEQDCSHHNAASAAYQADQNHGLKQLLILFFADKILWIFLLITILDAKKNFNSPQIEPKLKDCYQQFYDLKFTLIMNLKVLEFQGIPNDHD